MASMLRQSLLLTMVSILPAFAENPVSSWTRARVQRWAGELPLPDPVTREFSARLMQEEITGEGLLALDKDDLRELGLTKMGHLKTVSTAISRLLESGAEMSSHHNVNVNVNVEPPASEPASEEEGTEFSTFGGIVGGIVGAVFVAVSCGWLQKPSRKTLKQSRKKLKKRGQALLKDLDGMTIDEHLSQVDGQAGTLSPIMVQFGQLVRDCHAQLGSADEITIALTNRRNEFHKELSKELDKRMKKERKKIERKEREFDQLFPDHPRGLLEELERSGFVS